MILRYFGAFVVFSDAVARKDEELQKTERADTSSRSLLLSGRRTVSSGK